MKNNIIYLLIFYSLISCCSKKYDQFNSEDFSWLPYEIGDTLKFKSNLGSEDTWVVTNTYHEESNYGEGASGISTTNCSVTYYSEPHFELLHVYEQKKYIFFLKKYQDDSETMVFNTIRVAEFTQKSLSKGPITQSHDSILFDNITGSLIGTVQNLSIKKNIGISQYTLNETNEIYEKY